MNTSPRNLKILKELPSEIPELKTVIDRIGDADIGWNVMGFLKEHTDLSEDMEQRIAAFWKKRFFTDEYVIYDTPYPGADSFVDWLHEKGVGIIYLTGRDRPNMSAGTISSFTEHGFPVGDGARFVFKPDFDEPDLDFKLRALEEINGTGTVVLAVENEPGNANIIKRCCPGALVMLINTITSPSPEAPDDGILHFDHYPQN